jgi:hypothetical protein
MFLQLTDLFFRIYAIVGRFWFGLLASALSASIGSKGCPFGLVALVIWFIWLAVAAGRIVIVST